MSKKGENIYKRKDGRWEGRYIRQYDANGKAKYGYIYGKTYSDVKRWLLEKKLSAIDSPSVDSATLYSDILCAWLQSVRINIKESTYVRYLQLVDTHISPSLGKYPVSKISTQLVMSFIERQLLDGRLDHRGSLAPKTVSDILTIVKSSFEYAAYNGYSVSCNLSKLSIKKKDKEMRVLCQSEQDALICVLMDEMDLSKMGVLLSLYTGIRIGELCALQWGDMNLATATMKVRKTMQRIKDTSIGAPAKTKVIVTEPKSQCSIRDIPLPSFLVQIIRSYADDPKAYILTGDRNKFVEPRTMQNRFKVYVKESGIEPANFHALRHTFATRCVEVGFELKSLSEILGHANVNITLNRYVHSSFELKHRNMNKLPFKP